MAENQETTNPDSAVEQAPESQDAAKRTHWFSLKVLGASLFAFLILGIGRPYVTYYFHLDLAFLNQLSFGVILFTGLIAWLWNPICARVSQKLVFNNTELLSTFIISMLFVWSANAYPGHFMIAPHYFESSQFLWQEYELLDKVPKQLHPLGGDQNHEDYEQVFVNYAQGNNPGESVPWQHWIGPLSQWWPLYGLFAVICISLAFMVHKQWSQNEQLTYPIAQIGHQLFERQQERTFPDIFYSRMMWIAAGCVFFIHFYGMITTWFPGSLPDLSFKGRFNFLWNVFPILNRTGSFWLVDFHLMFSVIGLAYFLGREVGITLALSQVLLLIVSIQFYLQSGQVISGTDVEMSRTGAYIAYAVIILFTGRHYYWGLLKVACGKSSKHVDPNQAWIVRTFLLSISLLFVYMAWVFQLDPFLAFIFILLMILGLLAFTRLVCEIGGPYIQGQWGIGTCMHSLLGPAALGPGGLMAIVYISSVISVSANTALMPGVSNGLQVMEKARINIKRLFPYLSVATLIILAFGMYWYTEYYYDVGAQSKHAHTHSFNNGVIGSIKMAQDGMGQLTEYGQVEESAQTTGLSKIGLIAPDWENASWMALGAIGVSLFFFMRVRFSWFPLHPILFLVWNTFPIQIFYWSFFFGWCCKELVIRFGGGNIYKQAKPFFIGLILGDVISFAVSGSTSVIYNLITQAELEVYRVFIFF